MTFEDLLRSMGFELNGPPVMDGRWHRVPVAGDKHGARSGAYRGFSDGWANGHAHNWRSGEKRKWIAERREKWTQEQAQAAQAEMRARAAERLAALAKERKSAARKAEWLFEKKGSEEQAELHPYLARKRVENHGLRVSERGDLMMPLRNAAGEIQTLQFIRQDGSKQFWSGGEVAGNFFAIGEVKEGKQVLVAEGYATGATLHEATGLPVAVAGTASNLEHASRTVRKLNPAAELVLCADNDAHREVNPGLTAAQAAAEAVGGRVVAPPGELLAPGESDWNDLGCRCGQSFVRDELERHGIAVAEKKKLCYSLRA